MGSLCWFSDLRSVTGSLNISYKTLLPVETSVFLEAHIESVEGRKVKVVAGLYDHWPRTSQIAVERLGEEDTPYVQASSLFIQGLGGAAKSKL